MDFNNVDFVRKEFEGLYKSWLKPCAGSDVYKYWIKLLDNYNRSYHNFDHIASGLVTINEIQSLFNGFISHISELKMAWILHDVITGCRQAELLSACFSQRVMYNLSLREEIVYDLILETAPDAYMISGPSKTGLYEADLIHDIDFMILGQDWETFLEYDNNIEEEYRPRFSRLARAEFLRSCTIMNHIYRLDEFRKKYEKQALDNINQILCGFYLEEFKSIQRL